MGGEVAEGLRVLEEVRTRTGRGADYITERARARAAAAAAARQASQGR